MLRALLLVLPVARRSCYVALLVRLELQSHGAGAPCYGLCDLTPPFLLIYTDGPVRFRSLAAGMVNLPEWRSAPSGFLILGEEMSSCS